MFRFIEYYLPLLFPSAHGAVDLSSYCFVYQLPGTVGYTEKEAQEKFGEAAIECYVSSFSPLEWALTERHSDLSCFAKIVVHKEKNNKVRRLFSYVVQYSRLSRHVKHGSHGLRIFPCEHVPTG